MSEPETEKEARRSQLNKLWRDEGGTLSLANIYRDAMGIERGTIPQSMVGMTTGQMIEAILAAEFPEDDSRQ